MMPVNRVFLVLLFVCVPCGSSPLRGNHQRVISDDRSAGQLLADTVNVWFHTEAAPANQHTTVAIKPLGAGKTVRAEVFFPDGGLIEIDLTRPTVTRSDASCDAEWLRGCRESEVEGYTVQSTGGDDGGQRGRGYAVEVYDDAQNQLAFAYDRAGPAGPSAPLDRDQLTSLAVSCVYAFA